MVNRRRLAGHEPQFSTGRGGSGSVAVEADWSPASVFPPRHNGQPRETSMFEIGGQAEVLPVIYPNRARMAPGWPTGRN